MKRLLILPGLFLLLSGCQTLGGNTPEDYLRVYQDDPPSLKKFQACHDMGCQTVVGISMDDWRWNELAGFFKPAAESPAAERQQVASAVAHFEKLVGSIAGTMNDRPRNEGAMLPDAQLDCIAETVNTTTYLALFQKQGWLKWHTVDQPRHRGFLDLLGPHNTAVLKEKQTGQGYVVDTWFHANGELPEVVTVEAWMAGYDPEKK